MNNLEMLDSWKGDSVFSFKRSAQSHFGANQTAMASSGACGSACGDKPPTPKPSACGSACGTGDK